MNDSIVRVPFEDMPRDLGMSMTLDDARNPKPGSAHEFTAIWMNKVGANEYFRQLMEYQMTVGF